MYVVLWDAQLADAQDLGRMIANNGRAGYAVQAVTDGVGAMAALRASAVDLLFVRCCEEVTADVTRGLHSEMPRLPIIIFGGTPSPADISALLEAGASDYLLEEELVETTLAHSMWLAQERHAMYSVDPPETGSPARLATTVTAGALHDLNNLLTRFSLNLYVAQRQAGVDDKISEVLTDLKYAVIQTRQLVARMRMAGETDVLPTIAATSLAKLIEDAAHFALRGRNLRFRQSFDSDVETVYVDASQIRQVIDNIILNACQAMPDGGTIHASLKKVHRNNGQTGTVELEAGAYVRITIADRGCGIPAENLPRVFEARFSTKPYGTGYGLFTSRKIVRQHGGDIAVSSTARDTRFSIYLPYAGR